MSKRIRYLSSHKETQNETLRLLCRIVEICEVTGYVHREVAKPM